MGFLQHQEAVNAFWAQSVPVQNRRHLWRGVQPSAHGWPLPVWGQSGSPSLHWLSFKWETGASFEKLTQTPKSRNYQTLPQGVWLHLPFFRPCWCWWRKPSDGAPGWWGKHMEFPEPVPFVCPLPFCLPSGPLLPACSQHLLLAPAFGSSQEVCSFSWCYIILRLLGLLLAGHHSIGIKMGNLLFRFGE